MMPGTKRPSQHAVAVPLKPGQVPNLDVAALFEDDPKARQQLIEQLAEACTDPGFFCVHNSCVEKDLIRDTLNQMTAFFETADDGAIKQQVHNQQTGGRKGWGPLFTEPAYQPGTVAHVESFDLGQDLSDAQALELGFAPNIWPELPGFQSTILSYYEAVTRLGVALAGAFSEILGMEREFISARSGVKAPRTMRLLHYPAVPSPVDASHVGISAHTDFECFTILHQTASGLELTDCRGRWCQAPFDKGRFTVILGDMLERLSNGHFQATGHRVANTNWTRYSTALFFALDGDYPISPLPAFVDAHGSPRYPVVTQDQHIQQQLAHAKANQERAG
jgi:isopenicillin N synthase-like dioxygenase